MTSAQTRTMPPLSVGNYTATTALGAGRDAWYRGAARAAATCANDMRSPGGHDLLETWIGRVEGVETVALPTTLADWDCRNNRLAWLALQHDGMMESIAALRDAHGAERVAIVVGTSTSSIGATEEAYARLQDGRFPADLQRPRIHTRIRSAPSSRPRPDCAGRASPSPPRVRPAPRCSRRPRA